LLGYAARLKARPDTDLLRTDGAAPTDESSLPIFPDKRVFSTFVWVRSLATQLLGSSGPSGWRGKRPVGEQKAH